MFWFCELFWSMKYDGKERKTNESRYDWQKNHVFNRRSIALREGFFAPLKGTLAVKIGDMMFAF